MTTEAYYNQDRSITYPSHDIPMLKWWEGVYDHVFVVLHPFFRVPGYSRRSAAWGPVHLEYTDFEDIQDIIRRPARLNEAPDDFDEIIKRAGRPVRWSHVNEAIGNHPFSDFCLATWMATVEFRRNDSNENLTLRYLISQIKRTYTYQRKIGFRPYWKLQRVRHLNVAEFIASFPMTSSTAAVWKFRHQR